MVMKRASTSVVISHSTLEEILQYNVIIHWNHDLNYPSAALMYHRGSMKGVASEMRQNVKFSSEIPVTTITGHLALSSFSYVTTHWAGDRGSTVVKVLWYKSEGR